MCAFFEYICFMIKFLVNFGGDLEVVWVCWVEFDDCYWFIIFVGVIIWGGDISGVGKECDVGLVGGFFDVMCWGVVYGDEVIVVVVDFIGVVICEIDFFDFIGSVVVVEVCVIVVRFIIDGEYWEVGVVGVECVGECVLWVEF